MKKAKTPTVQMKFGEALVLMKQGALITRASAPRQHFFLGFTAVLGDQGEKLEKTPALCSRWVSGTDKLAFRPAPFSAEDLGALLLATDFVVAD